MFGGARQGRDKGKKVESRDETWVDVINHHIADLPIISSDPILALSNHGQVAMCFQGSSATRFEALVVVAELRVLIWTLGIMFDMLLIAVNFVFEQKPSRKSCQSQHACGIGSYIIGMVH